MREFSARKPNRLKGYDYSRNGAYFVTMCVKNRQEMFGHIVGATVLGRPSMELSELGESVEEAIIYYNKINKE